MKKYLKLTTREAISHFIKGGTLAPETSAEIRHKLADLADLKSDISVSIVIPTHRVRPDANKDSIVLKNRIAAAEKDLSVMLEKRAVWPIAENLREAEESIHNTIYLDSLVIYANEHFSSVVKLPIDLPEQTTICKYFDVRPLYKTMQQNRRYYIITVSREKIRLIEAFNDKAVMEIETGDFPFVKNPFYIVPPFKRAKDGFGDRMEKEFYNDADKSFKSFYNENPLPVVLAGDIKSVAYYEREMDDSSMVIGRITGSFDTAPLHEIMNLVAPEVAKYRESAVRECLSAIDAARSANLLTTDIGEIIEQGRNGNVDTLFIGNNFDMRDPAAINMSELEQAEYNRSRDDIFLGLLMDVTRKGGNIVFLEDDVIAQYGGIVIVKRVNHDLI